MFRKFQYLRWLLWKCHLAPWVYCGRCAHSSYSTLHADGNWTSTCMLDYVEVPDGFACQEFIDEIELTAQRTRAINKQHRQFKKPNKR